MGALTAREMDRQAIQGNQEKMFGGFVLLGAPNQGSKFVQSFRNGALAGFLSSFCTEVIADPILAALGYAGAGVNPWVLLLQSFDGDICSFASHAYLNGDDFKDYRTPSIDDFGENAPFLNGPNGINSFTSTTHKVSFEGNEFGPVHWRLLGANRDGVYDGLNLHQENATADQKLVNIMNDVENIELAGGILFSAFAIIASFNIATWILVIPAARAAYEFFDGYTWLQQSESKFNDLIGAFTSFQEMQRFRFFDCGGQVGSLESSYRSGQISMIQYYMGVSALYSNASCYREEDILVSVPNNGASDGIVPLSRQMLPTAAGHKTINGVNHFELRDHPDVTATFNLLFNGNLELNSPAAVQFFTTL